MFLYKESALRLTLISRDSIVHCAWDILFYGFTWPLWSVPLLMVNTLVAIMKKSKKNLISTNLKALLERFIEIESALVRARLVGSDIRKSAIIINLIEIKDILETYRDYLFN